jgi:GT2 family glycosyltransferase
VPVRRPPAVSCVLIFFNGASFIDEAIASVVGQQGIDDWELILVDDGSTDGSTAAAQEWAARDPARIRYAAHPNHENRGMSAARNLGISLAIGDYIGFLDCDDVWLPSALAHRMRVACSHPSADVVIGGTWRWYSWTGLPDDVDRDHRMRLPRHLPSLTTIKPPALFAAIYGTPGTWYVPAMCSLLIRRQALVTAGGMSQEFRGLHEDQVLYTKIALTMRVVLDERALALYRQHGGSACSTSIVSGQWSPTGRSPAEDRFLDWQRHYVIAASGTGSADLAVVEANASRPGWREDHADPVGGQPDTNALRHASAQLLRVVTRIRHRLRAHQARTGAIPTVIGEWSAQFLSSWATLRTGRVLVVIGQADAPEGWTPDVAASAVPGAEEVVIRRSGDLDDDKAFDHAIFTFGSDEAMAPAQLLDYARRHLSPSGTLSALFAGKDYNAQRSITPGALKALAVEALADRAVSVETFGNRVTMRPARDQTPAATVRGVAIDLHTADTEVVVALSAAPRQSAEVHG